MLPARGADTDSDTEVAGAGAVSCGEVATLAHEVGDDAVEGGSLVAVSLLAGAQGAEVLGGLGDDVAPQLHDDFSNGSAIGGDIKEHSGSHFGLKMGCLR